MKLSANFHREEFSCKCGCGQDTVDAALIRILEIVRAHFDSPITITSGNRCVLHNKAIGGASDSSHLIGKAADFKVKNVSSIEVYNFINLHAPNDYGLGQYSSWVHVDSRDVMARWG